MAAYSVWLSLIKNLSKRKKAALLRAFGSAQAVYEAGKADLAAAVRDLTAAELEALWNKDLREAHHIVEACRRCGAEVVDLTDPRYPAPLHELYDQPIVLYVRGKLPDFTARPAVAVVGQRKASAAGLKHASQLAYGLSKNGVIIVSGMAAGIDGAAHKGALDGGTPTVAVLGTPIDKCYPAHHNGLMREIIAHGAVISEYYPGHPTHPGNFLSRNRIVSGMSRGVLVVEAGARSGALETAGKALEQNRDVFAVPGPIDSPDYIGTNRLIKEGAAAVTEYSDILHLYIGETHAAPKREEPELTLWDLPLQESPKPKAIPIEPPKALQPDLPPEQTCILDAIGTVAHLDDIIEQTGLPAGEVMVSLTMLELQGLIAQRPGNYYEKKR